MEGADFCAGSADQFYSASPCITSWKWFNFTLHCILVLSGCLSDSSKVYTVIFWPAAGLKVGNDCLQLFVPSCTLRSISDTQPPASLHQTLHCWFLHLFYFWSISMEWPSPSSLIETLSRLIQIWSKKISFPKIVDLPCFLFSASLFSPSLPGICCPF